MTDTQLMTQELLRAACIFSLTSSRFLSSRCFAVCASSLDGGLTEAIGKSRLGFITMENHTSVGGLGTCVAELIVEHDLGKRLIKISTGDRYLQGASILTA